METENQVIVLTETEGASVSVVGDTYRVITSGADTGGAYAAIDMMIPPGGGPGPHTHTGIHESFYVVSGEVEFQTKEKTAVAKKGDTVTVPFGGEAHAFKNKSQSVAHLLCTVAPAGMDNFFQEIGVSVKAGDFLPPPALSDDDKKRMATIAEKYGQELFPPDYFG
ncbi:MAG: cupin domain-containing protein [Armatimonadetes bacterium]|nr:cupin domain-containing protein [Armatimonadota bacterium]